ncbi:hypothetical protein [Halococcus hamelinensis]|uniref:hypothetical protein n=2 Tax=Halococcus hamelinensis TaxID=332168 RepID=UPI000A593F76|nr:hypothetical protein [Halococcus hamelinensis]
MSRQIRVTILVTTILALTAISTPIATDLTVLAKENPGGHSGERSLGVDVSSEGDALDNVPVTVVNKKTKDQVFSGYTDSAGQISVTLPQGQYDVVAQGQKGKSVNLNKDQNVSFDLNSDERPKE